MKKPGRPLTLIILDGWGHHADSESNAISKAHTPTWDALCHTYPHTLIAGAESAVGLPEGQMGNSEVGHLNIGAGRIVYQDLTRIDAAIADGHFFSNPALVNAMTQAKNTEKAVHLLGLVSPGGVHSHENHLLAMIKLAAQHGISQCYIHAFLDGRDTPPRSAASSLQRIHAYCEQMQCGEIRSLIGRFYAMDRDKRWDRVEKAYDLLTLGTATYKAPDALTGLSLAYERGETDEFVQATCIHPPQASPATINDGDIVIFTNFRADRARELTESLIDPNFTGFKRQKIPQLGTFVCLSEYDARFAVPVAFPSQPLPHIFAEIISQLGMKQLRIAETEKYAHVTFFFNGGVEQPYPGETRILVPSPAVLTYDLQPQMSAFALTDQLVKAIEEGEYDVIVCNFANADMVGHTGNMPATVTAIETLDTCLRRVVDALQKVQGEAIITADHGNAEQMFDTLTNQPHTAHTCHLVPFIYIGRKASIVKSNGKLSDISPTMLYLLGISKPSEMTGESLLVLD